jgi:DNA mismatch endonuclease (patch repair protein)
MVDIVDRQTRSRMMSGIRGGDTEPELIVRSFLHRQGFRFRISPSDIAGRPDIVLPRFRTAIFVHGCFWHRHPRCKLSYIPKTRRTFWLTKFEQNVLRDWRVVSALKKDGWTVHVVWACQIDERRLSRLATSIRTPRRSA